MNNRKENEVKQMIRDINQFADHQIQQTQTIMRKYMKIVTLITVIGIALYAATTQAACTYRNDAFGNVKYNCDSGEQGTMRTDAFGNTRDSGTGTTYRTDAFGNTRGSDGSVHRTDAFGNVRSNDGTVWRTDAFGNVRSSNGTVCRTSAFGTVTCK